MINTTIAHYKVTAKLGQGGMGEVYRATDTKLDREVAIKILPPEFSQHPERLARFEREAKVLASLNHPNIAAIYGLEDTDAGNRFAVRNRAFSFSAARFFGGAFVSRANNNRDATSVTSETAWWKAGSLRLLGLVAPLSLRTNCNAAASISSRVAGGSKL